MCCLKYEHDTYEYFGKDTPKFGAIVETSASETGVVIESNILTGMCRVKINQKNSGDSGDNVIKPYFKKELKVIGLMKNEREYMYGESGTGSSDISDISDDDALFDVDGSDISGLEDEPAGSAIDIEL